MIYQLAGSGDNSEEVLIDGEIVICAYELFETIIVNTIDKLVGVYGNIQIQKNDETGVTAFLKLNFEGVDERDIIICSRKIRQDAIRIYEEDGIAYMNLCLTKGRDCYGL